MPTPAPAPEPELMEDLVAEILLRLPLDEPECLVRAAVVCKPWRRLLSDPAFLRRYRAFHRAPPVLGFLRNMCEPSLACFVLTTTFRPPDPDLDSCYALDCGHGRTLLYDYNSKGLLVWDPMTGEKHHLCRPDIPRNSYNVGVLCATAGCDHLDCHGGPFLVAFVCTDDAGGVHACIYSSETDAWSAPTSLQLDYFVDISVPPTLVRDALYFICKFEESILRYDLGSDRGLSMIDQPDVYYEGGISLMLAEDGGLGFAGLDMFNLYLWS